MAFDINNVGGFGTGALGDVTISNANTQVNSYAAVTAINALGYQITIGSPSVGAFGGFSPEQEVVFYVFGCLGTDTALAGKFCHANILAVNGNTISLDKPVLIADLSKYLCQVLTSPNFNNLTISCTISPPAYDDTKKYGGVITFKVKGTLDVASGKVSASYCGINYAYKPAGIALTNAGVENALIMGQNSVNNNQKGGGCIAVFAKQIIESNTTVFSVSGAAATGSRFYSGGNGGAPSYSPGAGGVAGYAGNAGAAGGAGGGGTGGHGGNGATTGYGGGGGGLGGYAGQDGKANDGSIASFGGGGSGSMLIACNSITGFYPQSFWSATGGAGGGGGTNGVPGNGDGGGAGGGGYCYITTNTIGLASDTAYALDTLIITKTSLLTTSAPWDLSTWTSVDGFTVTGNQPANTDRRFVFKVPIATTGARTYPISTNAVAGDTVTINGVTFTAVASGATGNQFVVGASTTVTATNLASTLNSNTTINALYTASASTNVVTLTEKTSGGGNTPGAATKTGTIVIDAGTVTTAVPTAGGYYKLSGSGTVTITSLATQNLTATSVLSEGNTAAELALATSIPSFAGKLVYPAMALFDPGDGSVIPTVRVTINGKNSQDTVSKTFDSGEIQLASTDVNVFSAAAKVNIVGAATAQVKVAAKQSGVWTDYVNLDQVNTLRGSAINIRAICTVPSVASGASSTVEKVTVRHRSNDAAVSGQFAEIVMLTDDFSSGLQAGQTAKMRGVRALLKHDGFRDATAKAWCAFRSQPKVRDHIAVGVGNQGNRLAFILGVEDANGVVQRDPGINHNTLQVWYGSTPVDIDFNTEVSEIYGSPPDGVTVFASYSYGWESEVWVQMGEGQTTPYKGANSFATDYSYTIPGGETKAVGCVKFELDKPVGSLPAGYSIGTVTGKQQMVYVPHKLRRETIVITPSAGTVAWTYDEDSGIITLVGSSVGASMTLAANWVAETPVSTGIVAAFTE